MSTEDPSHNKRSLFLIPTTLGDSPVEKVLPATTLEVLKNLGHFVVEDVRTARRFLIKAGYDRPIDLVQFYTLNEHTTDAEVPAIFKLSGNSDLGVLSEAGAPAVADPGSALVQEAHRQNIKVVPLTGPSSILLALMASGLNGQNFAFNGYLPVKDMDRRNRIRYFEKRSLQEKQAQIFIEAPYRNNQLFKALTETCAPASRLCIATNITLENENIQTKTIREWRMADIDLNRQPTVYVLQA